MADIRQLDFTLLLVFHRLYDDRSVTSVARRLNMSQPSVSLALSKLRALLGDELFLRTGRGMRPTPLAESIAPVVRRVVEILEQEILRRPSFQPSKSDRCFVISTSDVGVLVFVPALLRVLQDRAPSANLRCVTMPPTQLREALADGSVDLALGYFPDLHGAAIKTQHLFDHPFTCIARHDHPVVQGKLDLETFLACEHLMVSQEGRSQELFERRMDDLDLKPRVLLHLSHFMNVPQLISTTDMISIVPRAVGLCWTQTPGLQMLEPPLDIPLIPLQMHWHRRTHADPALVWFRELIDSQFTAWDPSSSEVFAAWQGRPAE